VSSGNVSVDMCGEPEGRWAGRHVLLVEDIIDSGNTLKRLVGAVEACGAESVRVVAMLDKKVRRTGGAGARDGGPGGKARSAGAVGCCRAGLLALARAGRRCCPAGAWCGASARQVQTPAGSPPPKKPPSPPPAGPPPGQL
jgi:hypothetical protein